MSLIIEFAQAGGPDVLQYKEIPPPIPGAGEISIRVEAIGLNRAESMWRKDEYIEPVVFPAKLGYEAAGTVEAVGAGVTAFAVGEKVNVIPAFSQNSYGTYGQIILAPIHAVVRQPETLSSVEAASIWMMFITAYGALIQDARLGSGQAVVIPAASSSVGLAAIQIANSVGAIPIAMTRSSTKRQALMDAGAKHVIASEEEDATARILEITEGKGANVIFDPVGGSMLRKLISAIAFQGIYYLYGDLADEPTEVPVLDMIAKVPAIKGHNIWLSTGDPERQKEAVAFVLAGLEKGSLRPVIDKTFAFHDMVQAHRYLETSAQFGKIVVTV